MKKAVYILLAGLFIILVVTISLLIGAQLNKPTEIPLSTETSIPQLNKSTETPLSTETGIPLTNTPLPDYEIVSANKIRKDKLIFAVSAQLFTCAELQIEVTGTFPSDYPFPSSSNVEGHGLYIYDDVKVMISSPNVSLKLDPSFGGGGSLDTNNVHVIGQDLAYKINPPLNIGQDLRIIAVVTFNKSFNIAEPVPFSIDVVAQQCQ